MPPVLNPNYHSEIIQYMAECVPLDESKPLFHTPMMYTVGTQLVFENLIPSTEYVIRVKSQSLSGWSSLSNGIVQKTLASVPDQPFPLEIIKVNTNGILVHWLEPTRCNGYDVDHYQLEVIDADLMSSIYNKSKSFLEHSRKETSPIDHLSQRFGIEDPNNDDLSLSSKRSSRFSEYRQEGGTSKRHRIMKHKKINDRYRFVTGLNPNKPYLLRIRAHNNVSRPYPYYSLKRFDFVNFNTNAHI